MTPVLTTLTTLTRTLETVLETLHTLTVALTPAPVMDSLQLFDPEPIAEPVAIPTPGRSYSAAFEAAWARYPQRPNQSKRKAWKAWQARLTRDHATPEELTQGLERYRAYVAATIDDPQHIMLASTFWGPDQRYADDFAVAPKAGALRSLSDLRAQHRCFN